MAATETEPPPRTCPAMAEVATASKTDSAQHAHDSPAGLKALL